MRPAPGERCPRCWRHVERLVPVGKYLRWLSRAPMIENHGGPEARAAGPISPKSKASEENPASVCERCLRVLEEAQTNPS
ncbi:MAG: hypothetical protein LBF21_00610 [Puniceicoccales bacterium]|nr:hypothetical protein [Puniceicoccales bacterium]